MSIDPEHAARLTATTAQRLERAPQWYRDLVSSLMRDNDGLRAMLQAGPEDSDTVADPYGDAPRPLGQGPTIRFSPDPDNNAMARFEVRLTEYGALRVSADTSINDELVVQPWSANTLYLKFVPRQKGSKP